jgi:septal ring factor EnvC (AmiA/AmiB activator)
MEEWRLLITALASAGVGGGLVTITTRLIDAWNRRRESAEQREARDDDELARVREEYRKDRDELQAEVRQVRKELDVVKEQLANTRVELAQVMAEGKVKDQMYSQLVEAHTELRRERDELRLQVAVLTNDNIALRKQLNGSAHPALGAG